MKRGFKKTAEKTALEVRSAMGITGTSRLNAADLVHHVGAELRCADELTSRAKLERLEALQPGAFSACTFVLGKRRVVVYSPLSSPARRQSDLAHEAAHIVLGHGLNTIAEVNGFSFFTCDPDEEQEANWLAGCLLLPRPLVYRATLRGLTPADIAEEFGVSEAMAAFRVRATGVQRQLRARGISRKSP